MIISKWENISRFWKGIIAIALITAITLLIYYPTLSYPFQFDDFRNIVENNKIQNISNFQTIVGTRYFGELSFALNYYAGGLNVFGYHLVNTIIHLINGILVWYLVCLTFKTPSIEGTANNTHLNSIIALISALIFISHPVQTQAITYIVQRLASLATLFYLLSIILFVKWRLSSGNRFRFVIYLLSLLSAVIAMKTKEISFTLPIIIVLYEFIFFNSRVRKAYYLIPFICTLLIIPVTIIGVGGGGGAGGGGVIGGIVNPVMDIVEDVGFAARETTTISRSMYLFTQFRVIITYIRLLFIPVNQTIDYYFPVYNSFFTPAVLISFLILFSIIVYTVFLFIRAWRGNKGYVLLVCFGIFWFFITLSVESSFIPIRDVIFEHRLYLPGIGVIIGFSTAMVYGLDYGIKARRAVITVLLGAVIVLSIAAYNRNLVWKDDLSLWKDVVAKNPLNARGRNNYGRALQFKGLYDDAIKEYLEALRINPGYSRPHFNLGNSLFAKGHTDEAIIEYRRAILINSKYPEAHNSLGLALRKKGLLSEAIVEYRKALKINPDYPQAHNNLGAAYGMAGRIEEARVEFNIALKLKPNYQSAIDNLELVKQKIGKR